MPKKIILCLGLIIFGIIKVNTKEIINKIFSIILVVKFLIIKSLLIIFSIKRAWISTPGTISPVGIFVKSNIPCAELPIKAILFLIKATEKLSYIGGTR